MEYARSASTGTVVRKLLPCLLTFGILVPTLTAQSIWWDEGISLHLAGLPWIELLENRASNIHPPAYFLILKAWTGLVGRTPFTGRYLSALAAFLLPALVYRFLVARAGTRAARTGLVLVALAPPLVIYGQEARAYSLLLLWALALWGLVWPAARRRPSGLLGDPVGRGVLLGVVQAGFLGTHYAAVIGVGVAALAYAVKAFRARDRELAKALWTEWLVGAGITALLVAPWLTLVIGAGVGGLGRQAGLANLTAEAAPAGYVARLIGIFHTVGLPQALSDPALTRPSLLVGALLLLGLALAFLKARCPRPVPGLLMLWLGPLLSVPVIWYLSPQSHPRYIYPYVFGGWLVAAAVIGAARVPRVVRLGLLGAILVTSLLGLQAYLTDPAYARSDVRAVAAYVRDHARAGDLVLVPHTDWSLEQYDVGAATVVMVPPEGGLLPPIAQDVSGEGGGAGARRVFAMDYRRGALDRRGALRAQLAWGGVLVARHQFAGVLLDVYELERGWEVPPCEPVPRSCVGDGSLCLVGAAYRSEPISGAAIPVRLCWEAAEPSVRYGVTVRLYAPGGALLASADEPMMDQALQPTEMWETQATSTYHVLPLPVGALPKPHHLELGLHGVDPAMTVNLVDPEGQPSTAVTVGEVVPAIEPWRETSLYGSEPVLGGPSIESGSAISVEGSHVDRAFISVGGEAFVTVLWRWEGDVRSDRLQVVLRQEGHDLAVGDLSASLGSVPAGRPLLSKVGLSLPATAEHGRAQIVLVVGDEELVVGELVVDAVARTFSLPQMTYEVGVGAGSIAELLGFDLEPAAELTAGRPVTVTLYWRAREEAGAVDLKVFTHLMVDGEIVAQHDAKPDDWRRPTGSWLPGEIVTDVHPLTWRRTDVSGSGEVRLGFYREETGARVTWDNGRDAFVLPVVLSIRPE